MCVCVCLFVCFVCLFVCVRERELGNVRVKVGLTRGDGGAGVHAKLTDRSVSCHEKVGEVGADDVDPVQQGHICRIMHRA